MTIEIGDHFRLLDNPHASQKGRVITTESRTPTGGWRCRWDDGNFCTVSPEDLEPGSTFAEKIEAPFEVKIGDRFRFTSGPDRRLGLVIEVTGSEGQDGRDWKCKYITGIWEGLHCYMTSTGLKDYCERVETVPVLKPWNGVPVNETEREARAAKVMKDLEKVDVAYQSSGDTLVIGVRNEDGSVEAWDCQIRKHAWIDAPPLVFTMTCSACAWTYGYPSAEQAEAGFKRHSALAHPDNPLHPVHTAGPFSHRNVAKCLRDLADGLEKS